MGRASYKQVPEKTWLYSGTLFGSNQGQKYINMCLISELWRVNNRQKRTLRGFHGSDYEECHLLEYDTMWLL
jgi:hypothetical protein